MTEAHVGAGAVSTRYVRTLRVSDQQAEAYHAAIGQDYCYIPQKFHRVGGLAAVSARLVLALWVLSIRALRRGFALLTLAYCAQSGVASPCLR